MADGLRTGRRRPATPISSSSTRARSSRMPAASRSTSTLALAADRKDGARLVVTGCMAERYGSELADALPEVDLVAGFGVPVHARSATGERSGSPHGPAQPAPAPQSRARGRTSRSRRAATARAGSAPSRASAVPSAAARPSRSSPRSTSSSVEEIVLVAQDLASYGRDVGRRGIVELVGAVARAGATGPPALPLPVRSLRRAHRRDRRDRRALLRSEPPARVQAAPAPDAALGRRRPLPRRASPTSVTGCPTRPSGRTSSSAIRGRRRPTTTRCSASSHAAQLDWCGLFAYSQEEGTYAAELAGQGRARAGGRAAGRAAPSSRTAITTTRRAALVGTTVEVLVDEPGVARSHREAPEIDGIIAVPAELAARTFATVEITGAAGPDLEARAVDTRGWRADVAIRASRRSGFGPSALATPANAVTAARLLVTPLMVLLIVRDGPAWTTVAGWFLLASTDGLDGYLARRQGTTRSGAFLDPLADKICVLAAHGDAGRAGPVVVAAGGADRRARAGPDGVALAPRSTGHQRPGHAAGEAEDAAAEPGRRWRAAAVDGPAPLARAVDAVGRRRPHAGDRVPVPARRPAHRSAPAPAAA